MITRRKRRGALLLVVLSMLILFVLISVTFVLTAVQYRRGAEAFARHENVGDPPQKDLDRAMLQLLRGTGNVQSVLLGHSLLEDFYGQSPLVSGRQVDQIVNVETLLGGQFIKITPPVTIAFPQQEGLYNGSLLTMVSGQAAGLSSRIIDFQLETDAQGNVTPDVTSLILEPFKSDDGRIIIPQIADRYLINDLPFNGTGHGWLGNANDPSSFVTRDLSFNLELAYQPNFIAYTNSLNPRESTNLAIVPRVGAADESWDAVDFQNMFLARIPVPDFIVLSDPAEQLKKELENPLIPSFHRPALINFWQNRIAGENPYFPDETETEQNELLRTLWRRIIMRPMPWDHPNFTGSNPAFIKGPSGEETTTRLREALINGPWDVDNDKDGTPDSIWIDLGMPIRSTADGRQYKPLYAILCTDLDNRLNVNAHGSWAQLVDEYLNSVVDSAFASNATDTSFSVSPPRGLGFGPADINLHSIFGDEYLFLLNTRYTGSTSDTTLPNRPGLTAVDDVWSQINQPGLPIDYFNANDVGRYGSVPDMHGRSFIALDAFGQPQMGHDLSQSERVDDPYELNLSRNRGVILAGSFTSAAPDPIYTAGELEAVLRYNDTGSDSLPKRLLHTAPAALAGTVDPIVSAMNRSLITTESRHVPVPPSSIQSRSYIDRIYQRMQLNPQTAPTAEELATLRKIIPLELYHGQLMDVNRPFGNGADDNDNGVADEPGEKKPDGFEPNAWKKQTETAILPPSFQNIFFHYLNSEPDTDQTVLDNSSLGARQIFARHLYCLMMSVMNREYIDPVAKNELDKFAQTAGTTPTEEDYRRATVRRIAQWAVNVVDFRDSDSIMTPFEFDYNPFDEDGWNVDGTIGSSSADDTLPNRGLVWGLERPEILISESLAFHDRRTEDLETPAKKTDASMDPDTHFDQRLRPQGSLFIELFNPWTGDTKAPGEFYYNPSTGTFDEGIILNKTAGGSPIWRMIVVKGDSKSQDPDNPGDPATLVTDIERSIYFATPPADPTHGQTHFTDLQLAPLMPGRYAVVGSYRNNSGNEYSTTIGRRKDATDTVDGDLKLDETRQIVLTYSNVPNDNHVELLNNGAQTSLPLPAVAIPILGLNISEPIGGYEALDGGAAFDASLALGEGAYETPIDEPLDQKRKEEADVFKITGTDYNFRMIHLQRLANPLIAWDPVLNPYRTIDSMPVDLTVFNGVTDVKDPLDDEKTIFSYSHQRGDRLDASEGFVPRMLWRREGLRTPKSRSFTVTQGAGDHYFDYTITHSLGYLNLKYQPAILDPTSPNHGAPDPAALNGLTFPWLTWHNRPFSSHLELMLVPASSSSLLAREFTTAKAPATSNPYDPQGEPGVPFGHLLSFFHSTDGADMAEPEKTVPNYYKILDYLEVPSRFTGAQKWFDAGTIPTVDDSDPTSTHLRNLQPPFNKMSRYRDPGRVNINTINDLRVWKAIFRRSDAEAEVMWEKLQRSRRGNEYGVTQALDEYGLDARFPTRLGNPFRSAENLHLAPVPENSTGAIGATLLREDPDAPNKPLFAYESFSNPNNNTDRSAYFRYDGIQRLANLLTTRSNVYAVWITVGYFEVSSDTDHVDHEDHDPFVHIDGFQLGQELGMDTGDIKRHRAFYIIDRSIPVAFQRGENHNVEKAVLVRRFIE